MNEFPYQEENGISTASTTNISTQIPTNLEPLKNHTITDSLQPHPSQERSKKVVDVDQYEQVTEIDEIIENDTGNDTIQAGINDLLGSEGSHFPLSNNMHDGQEEANQEYEEDEEEMKVEQQEESDPYAFQKSEENCNDNMMYEEEQDMYQYITIGDGQQPYHEVASGLPQQLMNEQTRPQQLQEDIYQRNLIVLGMKNSNQQQQLQKQQPGIPLDQQRLTHHTNTLQKMTTITPENHPNLIQYAPPPGYSYQQQYSFPQLNFAPQTNRQNPILIQQQQQSNSHLNIQTHSQNPYPQQQANNHAAAQHYNYAKTIQQQQNYNHPQQYNFSQQKPQILDIRPQKQGPKNILLEPIMVNNKSDAQKPTFPNQKQLPNTNSQTPSSGSASKPKVNHCRQEELNEQMPKKSSSFPATRQRIKQYEDKKQDTLTKTNKKLSKIDVMKDFILELSQHYESTQKILSPREIMTYAHQFTGRYPLVQEWESLAYCAGYFTPPTYCFNTKYICALTENGSPDRPRKSLLPRKLLSLIACPFELNKKQIMSLIERSGFRQSFKTRWMPEITEERVTKDFLVSVANSTIYFVTPQIQGTGLECSMPYLSVIFSFWAHLNEQKPEGVKATIAELMQMIDSEVVKNHLRICCASTLEEALTLRTLLKQDFID